MSPVEIIVYTIVLGGLALLIGFLCIVIPNAKQNRQPRRHHFKEPAPMTFKENVHANNLDGGSTVDNEKALKSFTT